jgi:DNA-binding transcriptional MerR regulator
MPARDNRQPAATAETDLTVDELADRVGMTVRNLREWRTLGLLPRAEMRGRVGYYSPEVVERVERIQKLHAEGFTLELISRMLDAGGDAGDEVMRLAATLRAPVEEGATTDAGDRIARIGAGLEELGLSFDEVLNATARIQGHAEGIAEIFEQVWLEQIWEPFIEAGMPEEELPRIQETAAKVKPLALEAVVALFTAAMDAQIERGIARELGRATGRSGDS